MENRTEFLKKLNGLLELAKQSNNRVLINEVQEYFSQDDLTEEQMELVFDYLLTQKVVVQGYLKATEEQDESQSEITYTEEEKVYLNEYLQDLEAFKTVSEEERRVLFEQVIKGDAKAKRRLMESYLQEVVSIAKTMYQSEIFLGDLIQEGNLGLVLGVDMLTDVETAHDTIVTQIKQGMQMLIEEYNELSLQDKQMLEKVNMLDEGIKTLTEELGRKVSVDELAVHMGMTEDEILDILRLLGEEVEEEEEEK